MGKYGQAFALEFNTDADRLWSALKRAIDDMDGAKLGTVDEDSRELEFSTGVTLTSWGEELKAAVAPNPGGGAEIQVGGKPKGTFLTTKWGEEVHARTIEGRLKNGVEAQLA